MWQHGFIASSCIIHVKLFTQLRAGLAGLMVERSARPWSWGERGASNSARPGQWRSPAPRGEKRIRVIKSWVHHVLLMNILIFWWPFEISSFNFNNPKDVYLEGRLRSESARPTRLPIQPPCHMLGSAQRSSPDPVELLASARSAEWT